MIFNGHELNSGDIVLVDIDGYLTKENRPDGSLYYPEFGPIITEVVEFLEYLKSEGIKIHIWTARINERDVKKWKRTVKQDISSVLKFLSDNHIPYDHICFHYKPLGTHYAKLLFDDRTHTGY